MASERQIAANRRNAERSTGPRSAAGKTRIAANAHRHGLRSPISSQVELEELARDIAGSTTDPIAREHAYTAAHAELELRRARRTRLALIERAGSLGGREPPQSSSTREVRAPSALNHWFESKSGQQARPPDRSAPEDAAAMPTTEPERTAEAMRRVLPVLIKLTRYEYRAAATRDKAIRQLSVRLNMYNDTINAELATVLPNKPNF